MLKFLLSDFKKLSLILVIFFIILISLFFLTFLAVILIPLAALFLIYRILFKVLFKKKYPNYLKYMSFHIVLVPTMFHFWDNPNILLFVLIFYLQIFYQEFNNLKFYE